MKDIESDANAEMDTFGRNLIIVAVVVNVLVFAFCHFNNITLI